MAASIASTIKHARRAQQLTQVQLAKRARITQGSLSKIERGQQVPSIVALQHLAKALGLDIGKLLKQPAQHQRRGRPSPRASTT
jgi:transcriptional regulator with XRE-family HTH domain